MDERVTIKLADNLGIEFVLVSGEPKLDFWSEKWCGSITALSVLTEIRDWLNAYLPFTLHLEGDEQPAPYSAERLTPSQVAEQLRNWFATQDDMEAKHG